MHYSYKSITTIYTERRNWKYVKSTPICIFSISYLCVCECVCVFTWAAAQMQSTCCVLSRPSAAKKFRITWHCLMIWKTQSDRRGSRFSITQTEDGKIPPTCRRSVRAKLLDTISETAPPLNFIAPHATFITISLQDQNVFTA